MTTGRINQIDLIIRRKILIPKCSNALIAKKTFKNDSMSIEMWLCTQLCVFTFVFVHDDIWILMCTKIWQSLQKKNCTQHKKVVRIMLELIIVKDFLKINVDDWHKMINLFAKFVFMPKFTLMKYKAYNSTMRGSRFFFCLLK